MRNVAFVVLIAGLLSSTVAARQAGGGATAAGAVKACSLLSRDLALKVTGTNKALFDLPPRESPVGKGSECNWGDIQLRVDPFPWASLKGMMSNGPKWTPVSGVGDEAFFRDNRQFAELMARVGPRTFTIQMGVPVTSTAEKIQPNVITLANAIAAKLK